MDDSQSQQTQGSAQPSTEPGRLEKLNIFEFSSYRKFLTTHFLQQKEKNPSWSYGSWAKLLKLGGTAVLTNIINGKRNPGPKLCDCFSEYFRFSTNERDYFESLVHLEKAKDRTSELHLALLEKMEKFNPGGTYRKLNNSDYKVLTRWYAGAIREMTHFKDFHENIHEIKKRLIYDVPEHEIIQTIEDLISIGLLVRDKNGKLSSSGYTHVMGDDVSNEAWMESDEKTLDFIKEAVRKIPFEERDFRSLTFSIRNEDIPRAMDYIRSVTHKFCDIFHKEPGDEVYQFSVQLIPMTKKEKSD